ncbi:hypothetical protein WJX82_006902 [Trebouxia sp. C0006]
MLNSVPPSLNSLQDLRQRTSEGPSCVYLTAPWCAFCRLFEPKYGELRRFYPQVEYFKLDVDIVEGVDELKSIHTLPSLLLYEDGALVHIVEDLPQKRPGKKLAAAIRQYLLHERGSEEQQSAKRPASAGQAFGDVASSAVDRVPEDAHLAHCLSIPGQIDLHEHGTGNGGILEGAQAISTPRQVQIQDRVGDQSVIDASVDSLLPGMAPVGDVDGATKCIHDQLADVTEASCPPKSEGPVATSLPTRPPARLTLPDPSLVNRQSSQLSPLGKKPPLCGPIELHATTADSAGSPAGGAATDSKADGRPWFEAPRSSLSPAGGSPSTSHHIHMPHLFGQSQPKPLRVRAVTFNMAKKMPTDLPEELLGRAGCPEGLDKYDIVVIGTQESGSSQEWNKLVAKALGAKYVKLASESLWQIRVLVYVRAKLREHITAVATSSVATGIGNVAGNKGGVGVALTYMDHTRLLFVNAHFQAHTHRVAGRQADYLRIKAGLFNNREEAGVEWAPYAADQDAVASPSRSPLSKADHTSPHTRLLRDETGSMTSSESSFSLITSSFTQRLQQWAQPSIRDVADDYHVTIWLGDLNYRVETGGNRRVVDGVLKMTGLTEDERLNVLRNNDQLKKERELGKVFLGYKEGELTFPPTYKFDPGTDVYDSSGKSRVPSWCDRVLWRCNTDAVELLQYTHVPQLKVSDHRPVVATFLVHAQPAPQGMPREKGALSPGSSSTLAQTSQRIRKQFLRESNQVSSAGGSLKLTLLTHGHADHVGALPRVLQELCLRKLAMKHGNLGQKLQSIPGILNCRGIMTFSFPWKKENKILLFSNHNGSLLRRQHGALLAKLAGTSWQASATAQAAAQPATASCCSNLNTARYTLHRTLRSRHFTVSSDPYH